MAKDYKFKDNQLDKEDKDKTIEITKTKDVVTQISINSLDTDIAMLTDQIDKLTEEKARLLALREEAVAALSISE